MTYLIDLKRREKTDMPRLIKDIDLVIEKFLTGYSQYGKSIEIFENPTKKEQGIARKGDNSYSRDLRFIADGEKKRLWIWNAGQALHSDSWEVISKEIGDSRRLYKDFELVSGEIDVSEHLNVYYVVDFGGRNMAEAVLDIDWSWADKYFKGFGQKFEDAVRHEMERKGWI